MQMPCRSYGKDVPL